MTVQGYEIDIQRHLVSIDPDKAAERSQQLDSTLWLDIEGPDKSKRAVWLERLGIDGLEAYLRLQVTQELAFTPSAQLLIDPAQIPDEDQIWQLRLWARFAF